MFFDWPESQTIDGLELRCTCGACPEQYEVFDGDNQVAYFRLRHGEFRVDFGRSGGATIFLGCPIGDGQFEKHERQSYLMAAIAEVRRWMSMTDEERDLANQLIGFVRSR